jgi:hypothetical protein
LTIAPLTTASAAPQGIPLSGTISNSSPSFGTVTGLGPVALAPNSDFQLVVTTRNGDSFLVASGYTQTVPGGFNYTGRIVDGTGRFEGASGEFDTIFYFADPSVLHVAGVLILNP